MSLTKFVKININYTRSINLERDYSSNSVVDSYIPTSRSIFALKKSLETLDTKKNIPRAWTIVGPYGSGKSSFGIFLSHLLSSPDKVSTKNALDILGKYEPKLKDSFAQLNESTLGYCTVLLTGSPEPLGKRLLKAINVSVQEYWKHRRGKVPFAVLNIKNLSQQKEITTTEIIDCIKEIQQAIGKIGGNGLLIIIDELGKFLEYEARHTEIQDIYLLQALAELAYTGDQPILSLYVLLHQSFEQYAKGLGDDLKNEWAKVHGRFESIPFLEATEQTLQIVGNAINHDTSMPLEEVTKQASHFAKVLSEENALPGNLDENQAQTLFTKCYPLHPISVLILPVLCQKIAQNERTLFNYLGSEEKFGFKDRLSELQTIGDWVHPWEVYEYFIQNQSSSLTDHFTYRRWSEVITAVDRLGDSDALATLMLKTIGILNIIGTQAGFKASKKIIELCFPTVEAKDTLEYLVSNSFIQYRKYNNEYRVWQGSDFDIESIIIKEKQKIGFVSIAEYLNKRQDNYPIIARRFSIEKGTLHYFETVFVDIDTYSSINKDANTPRVVFYLSQNQDDINVFKKEVLPYFGSKDVVVRYPQSEFLRNSIYNTLILLEIEKQYSELATDPVAQHEFSDRLKVSLKMENSACSDVMNHPENGFWYLNSTLFSVSNKRDLQSKLSNVLDKVYKYSPVIKNELINKNKPSSQAAAGRKKLLQAMLARPDHSDLGIEKFPPEKAMYRAVLRETGIHRKTQNKWGFNRPTKESSIFQAWIAMEKFLESTSEDPCSFTELSLVLCQPPYGIKIGVLPVLYLSLYLANQNEVALYENGKYLPSISLEILERFIKKPEIFTIQQFKIEGINASLFQHYSDALFPEKKPETIIQAIKPLAQFIGNLNHYTQKTSDISKSSQKLRSAFHLAKSPEELLFVGIPSSLGYKKVNNSNLEGYADSLKTAIQELKYAYDNLLKKHAKFLANAFNLTEYDDLAELRVLLRGRYEGLEKYTVDIDGLKAFILRLTSKDETDQKWFLNLLTFLGNKFTDKWENIDQNRAEMRLSEYARRILDLEALRLEHDKSSSHMEGHFDVILLKSIKKGSNERRQAVTINAETHEMVQSVKTEFHKLVERDNKELKLAVLAELVDEFLQDYQTTEDAGTDERKQKMTKVKDG